MHRSNSDLYAMEEGEREGVAHQPNIPPPPQVVEEQHPFPPPRVANEQERSIEDEIATQVVEVRQPVWAECIFPYLKLVVEIAIEILERNRYTEEAIIAQTDHTRETIIATFIILETLLTTIETTLEMYLRTANADQLASHNKNLRERICRDLVANRDYLEADIVAGLELIPSPARPRWSASLVNFVAGGVAMAAVAIDHYLALQEIFGIVASHPAVGGVGLGVFTVAVTHNLRVKHAYERGLRREAEALRAFWLERIGIGARDLAVPNQVPLAEIQRQLPPEEQQLQPPAQLPEQPYAETEAEAQQAAQEVEIQDVIGEAEGSMLPVANQALELESEVPNVESAPEEAPRLGPEALLQNARTLENSVVELTHQLDQQQETLAQAIAIVTTCREQVKDLATFIESLSGESIAAQQIALSSKVLELAHALATADGMLRATQDTTSSLASTKTTFLTEEVLELAAQLSPAGAAEVYSNSVVAAAGPSGVLFPLQQGRESPASATGTDADIEDSIATEDSAKLEGPPSPSGQYRQ